MSSALTFAAFWGLVAFTAASPARRAWLRARLGKEWALDLTGLLVQGVIVPLAGGVALARLLATLMPAAHRSVAVPWLVAFALSFVAIDYLYYWNHRLLHTRALWRFHFVHHTSRRMDVFVTSRNTLWTSALIVYVWANGLFGYLLEDPAGYIAGATLTSILDLARHAPIDLSRWPALERALGSALVLPRDHANHHADTGEHGNYGANLSVWDRLHGTYLGGRRAPDVLGIRSDLPLARALFWPRVD
ncbi:MAG TPA: sterol desaturase family protein [Labilithrix sp.]|nr:sterol desaturase family protein [Labilithrix sp.]